MPKSKSKKRVIIRKTKNNKNNKNNKSRKTKNKKMKGGDYTEQQKQQLLDLGFTPFFVKIANGKIGMNVLISDFNQSNLTPQQYMDQTYDNLNMNQDDGMTDSEGSQDSQGSQYSQGSQNAGKKRNKRTRKHRRKNKKHNKSRK